MIHYTLWGFTSVLVRKKVHFSEGHPNKTQTKYVKVFNFGQILVSDFYGFILILINRSIDVVFDIVKFNAL